MNDDNWTTLQSAGKVPPPSPEVLAHATDQLEQVASRGTRRRTVRRVLAPALGAVATAAAISVVVLQQSGVPTAIPAGPSAPSASTTTYPKSKPLGQEGTSFSCVTTYSPAELRKRDFAIDGTVVSAKPIPRTAGSWAVTFEVHEWFHPRGGAAQLTIQMWIPPGDGIQSSAYDTGYQIGDRLLIAGALVDPRNGKALKYPSGGACGFGRTYDVPTADTWRKAFRK